jgi:hypothetical protein
MAYNNYFPTGYQPAQVYYPQNNYVPQQNAQAQQAQSNGMIWVVGEGGADSYLVAPGQTVLLWDSTAPVIYLKSADSLGRPSKKILDYTERGASAQTAEILPESDFVRRDEVDNIRKELDALWAKFEGKKGVKKDEF